MIRRLTDPTELAAARDLRRSVADGPAELSARWLAATEARVLAQESGRHLEVDEVSSVAEAYAEAGIHSLVAVVTDALVVQDEAYALGASPQDLAQLSSELAGVNFVLLDSPATHCILFTTDDYKLVAGPPAFVTRIVGDPRAAMDSFIEFAADQLEEMQPAMLRAESYMSWVTGSE